MKTRINNLLTSLWVQYGVLSLAVMMPLLIPGYILSLDLVFVPHLAWPQELSNTYVFNALLHVANLVLPADVVEKIILVLILVLSGVGAHKLALSLATKDHKFILWGAYFAGVFYTINPFTYSRFMAGQYLVLLGYALFPFFVRALFRLVSNPSWRSAVVAGAWATAIIGVSIHHSGMLLLVAGVTLLVAGWSYRRQLVRLKKVVIFGVMSVGAVLLASSYWLVPSLFGTTQINQATASFGQPEFEAFATTGGALGAVGNVVRLQGFWVEGRNMYLMPQDQVPLWGLVMLAVWVLVVAGALRLWSRHKTIVVVLGLTGIAAIILASTPLVSWLAQYLPFVAGYREPHKFVGLLALAYAIFGAFGVQAMLEKVTKKQNSPATLNLFICLALLLPLVCTPTMLWGFAGQLAPRNYPSDWHEVNKKLNDDQTVTKVLFLPWHQYIEFSFSERIIANPAPKFFDKPTVAGDNPEYLGVRPTVPNAESRRIEKEVLAVGNDVSQIGARLKELGFSHVLLAKEYDYDKYEYLNRQSDLTLVTETNTLKLYAIRGVNE